MQDMAIKMGQILTLKYLKHRFGHDLCEKEHSLRAKKTTHTKLYGFH